MGSYKNRINRCAAVRLNHMNHRLIEDNAKLYGQVQSLRHDIEELREENEQLKKLIGPGKHILYQGELDSTGHVEQKWGTTSSY